MRASWSEQSHILPYPYHRCSHRPKPNTAREQRMPIRGHMICDGKLRRIPRKMLGIHVVAITCIISATHSLIAIPYWARVTSFPLGHWHDLLPQLDAWRSCRDALPTRDTLECSPSSNFQKPAERQRGQWRGMYAWGSPRSWMKLGRMQSQHIRG